MGTWLMGIIGSLGCWSRGHGGDVGVWGCGVWGWWLRSPRVPRGCFREYFVHKFRAMLGKNRVIFPGEKVPGGDPERTPGGGPRAGDRPCCPHRCCWQCQGAQPPVPWCGRCRR